MCCFGSGSSGRGPRRPRAPKRRRLAVGDPADLVGRHVVAELPDAFERHERADGKGLVLRANIFPWSPDEARELYEDGGANEYDVLVEVSAEGAITDIVFRIEPNPCSPRSFTPHEAPAWVFGPGARFVLEWDHIAPRGQERLWAMLQALAPAPARKRARAGRAR